MRRSDDRWPDDRLTRWSRRLLAVAAWWVPHVDRADWLREWEAELWQLRREGQRLARLCLFVAGAFAHGIWEWKEGWRMDFLMQDLRFTIRTLGRSPGFTFAAVTMLALSIAASTALFSVLEEAVLADGPFPEPERLVVVDGLAIGEDGEVQGRMRWSYPRYEALREEISGFEEVAGYSLRTMTLTELGDPQVVSVEAVTPSLFPVLEVGAIRGRVFGPDEVDDGAAVMVALVSAGFWQRRMGASMEAVGSTITLDRMRLRVLGVLPPDFHGATGAAEVWVPMSALRELENPTLLTEAWNNSFDVMARLAPDAAFEATRAEVEAFGARIKERWPPPPGANQLTFGGDIVPFLEARVNPVARTSMLALFGAVVLVVLIATANLAGLLLARGATRHREAAIRSSLGAGHARLLRQLLTESLSLAAVGGIAGLVIAWLGVDLLGAWLADAVGTSGARSIEFFDPTSVSIDWRVLAFTAGLTGGVGVGCGIFPAWQAARTDPNASLRGTSAGPTGSRGIVGSGRGGLIIVQVSVALVLLSGTTLMMRSLVNLQRVDLGYDTENLLTAVYSLTPAEELAGVDPSTFHIDFLERVRALPGVTAATMGEVPMGGPTWRTIVLGSEGRPELTPEMHLWTRLQPVADGHLTILGANLLEGRDIERSDGPETERVVVLNRMAAEELFPGGSPLGQRIQLPWEGYSEPGATVVGVVEDLQLGEPSQPLERQAYVAIRQAPQLQNGLMVRTSMEASEVFPALRAALAELNPNVVLTSTMTMDERAAGATARSRAVTMLLGIFSAASLLLVAAGLYGTVAFTVARRTSELGLRASLGAGRYALATLVLRRGLGVTIAGIGAGLVGAVWATRFLDGILFGATGADTVTLVGTSVALLAVALVACYVPARRAMRIDPMVALRTD